MAICIVKRFGNEQDEEEAIIESNRTREKTPLQVYNEASRLKIILTNKAKERKKLNLVQYSDVRNFHTSEGLENESGKTSDKLTAAFNMKRDRLEQLLKLGDMYVAENKNAIILMNEYGSGEITLHAAMKKLELMELADSDESGSEYAGKLVKQIDKGITTPRKAEISLKAYLKKENNKIAPITADELHKETYNVIVTYPPKLPDKDAKITDAKNAALFVMASAKNVKEMIEHMETWGFKLKDIAVWNRTNTGGTYFQGKIGLLLLGIKGHMERPEKWEASISNCPIIFKTQQAFFAPGTNMIPECVYYMAEQMFPGQKYLDLSLDGWPQSTCPKDMESNCSEATKQNNDEVRNESSTDSDYESMDPKSTDRPMPEENSHVDQTVTEEKDPSKVDWL